MPPESVFSENRYEKDRWLYNTCAALLWSAPAVLTGHPLAHPVAIYSTWAALLWSAPAVLTGQPLAHPVAMALPYLPIRCLGAG